MKVTKIIPKTIPILILRHEKPQILSKIGQNVPYLVVLDGYTHTLGGRCSIQLSYTNLLRYYTALCSCSQPIAKNCSKPCAVAFFSTAPIILYLFGNRFSNRFLLSNQILSSSFSTGFYDFAVHWWRNSLGVVPYCFLNCLLKYDTLLNPTW